MAQSFTISSRYLSVNGELVLKAMISLTKLSPSVRWEYTSDADSHIVIIDTDQEEGRRMWMDLSNSGCRQVLVAYTAKANKFPDGSLVLTKPLRSNELVPLLERVTQERLTQTGDTDVAGATLESPNLEVLAPETTDSSADSRPVNFTNGQRVLDVLMRHGDTPVRISGESSTVIVERSRHQYFGEASNDAVKALLLADNDSVQIEEIAPERLVEYTGGLTAQELDAPLWEAVLNTSGGHLLNGLSANHSYRLRRWPDFKKLDHKPIHVRLTVFLSKRGGSIDGLSRVSGIPADRVIDFVNACHALQYLEIQTEPVAPPAEKQPVNKSKLSLFGRIRARLGI